MMAGRSDRAEGVVEGPFHDEIDGFENAPDGQQGHVIAVFADLIVRVVQFPEFKQACFFEAIDMFRGMHPFDPCQFRWGCLNESELRQQAIFLQCPVSGLESVGAFRMSRTGAMAQKPLIIQQTCSSHELLPHFTRVCRCCSTRFR